MAILSSNIHKAQRRHGCMLCTDPIEKGQQYYRASMPGSDKQATYAFHLECYRAAMSRTNTSGGD